MVFFRPTITRANAREPRKVLRAQRETSTTFNSFQNEVHCSLISINHFLSSEIRNYDTHLKFKIVPDQQPRLIFYSAKHELWGACAPKRVRRRIETVFSHADLESCDEHHRLSPPPNFGNDRHVKFLAVALHSHLNNGPDCCHRFVERPFMAEKKKLPSTIIR